MMKLYSENEYYKLYQGNMLNMLEVINPESIDSIVTDPPYGLTSITKRFGKENSAECQYGKDGSFARLSRGFMGKEWDGSGIEYNIETWKKCYEVLKPGGYLLAFGGSRTFHRIACAIEDAGFEIRDTIMWLYASGFPKSMDISKQIDKRNGRNPNIEFKNYLNKKRKEKGYSLADINKLMNVATNGGGFASSIMGEKDNIILPTKENYNKLKKILDLDNRYDELINTSEAERKVIGKSNYSIPSKIYDIANGSGERLEQNITIPATDLAKQWQGWGTALKPSFEPIIVARKPFKGSLVDNVIEYGVGGINIDECRVETNEEMKSCKRGSGVFSETANGKITGWNKDDYNGDYQPNNLGRFPANTILTYDDTDFDEVCGGFPDTTCSGDAKTGRVNPNGINYSNKNNIFGGGIGKQTGTLHNDSGSASRYFYCAKASKKDRDEGLDNFEEKNMRLEQNREIHSAGCEYIENGKLKQNPHLQSSIKKNIHPTVKPTELMQYLVRLVSPDGATILDPFNGSGSTGKAVMYENKERNKNYKYIGIELTEEYLPIAKARIEYAIDSNTKIENEKKENAPEGQLTIFDFEG